MVTRELGMKRVGIVLVLVLLIIGAVWGFLRTKSDETTFEKLVLTGSSTVAPLAAEIGKRFESLHSNVRVDVQT
jgi:phosphate transport system substrate-binding protein